MMCRRRWLALGVVIVCSCSALTNLSDLGGDAGDATTDVMNGDAPVDASPDAALHAYSPPHGFYLYSTSIGGDTITIGDAAAIQRSYEDAMCAVVSDTDAGDWAWNITFYFLSFTGNAHYLEVDFTTQPGTLASPRQAEFIQGDRAVTQCVPSETFIWNPLVTDGGSWLCPGGNSLDAGGFSVGNDWTYVADEPINVGTTPVMTHHVKTAGAVTQSQKGTQSVQYWLRTADGLPVQVWVNTTISTSYGNLAVTYAQNAIYNLVTMDPADAAFTGRACLGPQ
jgi:hypothetical protein